MNGFWVSPVIKLLAETKVCQDSMAFGIKKDVLRLKIADDNTMTVSMQVNEQKRQGH